jgi:hypothetical protein
MSAHNSPRNDGPERDAVSSSPPDSPSRTDGPGGPGDPKPPGGPDRIRRTRLRRLNRPRPFTLGRAIYITCIWAGLILSLFLLADPEHEGVIKAVAGIRQTAGQTAGSRAAGPETTPQPPGVAVPVPGALQPKLPAAAVTIPRQPGLASVPRSFLGISTEYWALPLYESHMSLFERVLAQIHPQGDGPFVLRIGGDSADQTFWDPTGLKMPRWAVGLTPIWLQQTRQLVQQTGARVILDLNLVTGSVPKAAMWARVAAEQLPAGSIAGFEIGNEPDIYDRIYWREFTEADSNRNAIVLPRYLTARTYVSDFGAYQRALAQFAPRIPLIGPAIANPYYNFSWISGLIQGPHPGLGTVSAHRYPYSACALPNSPGYPTIPRLLSERATAGMAATVTYAAALAHRSGFKFRLTELNSVTCGGRAGVSNTFATALWAPDALFELLKAGVDGVSVHVRANLINAAFRINRNGLEARPLLYGLILFARAFGPHSQLVRLNLQANPYLHLKAWAVSSAGNRLNVLLIDKSRYSANVNLRVPAIGPGTVHRLLAPAVWARTGITLDGQQLGLDGSWRGQPSTDRVARGRHGYLVTVPAMSAAIVSLRLRPGALRHLAHGAVTPLAPSPLILDSHRARPHRAHRARQVHAHRARTRRTR